jgi:hypothetical protein
MAAPTFLRIDTLCLLLAALADVPRLPAQPWAMSDALSYVQRRASDSGQLRSAVRAIGQSPFVEHTAREATRRLVATGKIIQAGSGWHAGYEVDPSAADFATHFFDSLPPQDQRVVRAAAQRLVAMTTIWSKNSLAEGSARSATN